MLQYSRTMENQSSPDEKARNPITNKAYRREAFWQITLPFIVGLIIFLSLAVTISLGTMGETSMWADISVIWLILIMLLPGLVLLILLVGLVYGVTWLFVRTPEYALQLQNIFELITWRVKQNANKVVEPMLRFKGSWAGLKSIFRR
ncbi:MAG: hypothetical protein JW908_11235 [Anaerolineales bacterium]|nr:hypothetical protein [Anaerolineales bacterium]